jgi:branched-subunit amino acid aminotransferase/4-amino-4-deoxychorismate lyase
VGTAWADVDGRIVPLAEATIPVTDPAVTLGWSVFETIRVADGRLPLLEEHLERLHRSATVAALPAPDLAELAARATRLASRHAGPGRVRIVLTGGGRSFLWVEDVDPSRRGQPVRAVTGPHRDEPFLGAGCKHGSRAPWAVAVRRAGVDDVLLVDAGRHFTEATTAAILAERDGALLVPPDDGRTLASTTQAELVEACGRLGLPVRVGPIPLDGPWDALYVASATRWIAPVAELDGRPLPGWGPVGRRLHEEGPPR